ncbi:hypothetical protein [Psychroserpens sp. NJDZ02]|uniref:hypothetical protein n=1 Tax=Psychroserpens sp. NJDZ02 TaxID=2570561 RepID=UPI0010A7DDC4|nr:hypothetical protein [Psychroserpens sp. NJDZ02]QCE40997.1 hypothetical protein E9099_06045 [Psychroserpens sp. NJDZ02]
MDVLKISTKTFLKLIAICFSIALVTGTIFYFTKGGFFDGILMTFVGLSLTYLTLIVSLLIYRFLINFLAKKTIKVSHVVIAFMAAAAFAATVFISLFRFIANTF